MSVIEGDCASRWETGSPHFLGDATVLATKRIRIRGERGTDRRFQYAGMIRTARVPLPDFGTGSPPGFS